MLPFECNSNCIKWVGLTDDNLSVKQTELMLVVCSQVYHISRNLWSRLETRTVKNVCAPAAVIEDKIYIIGGELTSNLK